MAKKKPPVKKTKKKAAPKVKSKARSLKVVHLREPPRQTLIPDRDEQESVTMTEITTVKKLTTKIIVGKKIGKVEQRKQLYSVIGVATGLKVGESNYGAWTGLVGRFEAQRTDDGVMFSAPLLLLPDVAAEPIIRAVKIHEGVEFALVVTVEPTLSEPGYVYDIASVVTPRKNDMLAGLREAMRTYLDAAADPL
jgi:hypothetical protein